MGAVRYKIVDDEVIPIHKVIVARFEIFRGSADQHYTIRAWFQSDPGKFVTKHAIEPPKVESVVSSITYDTNYYIIAELEEKRLSEFYLRWGKYGNDQT
jgi:hypothetical protein